MQVYKRVERMIDWLSGQKRRGKQKADHEARLREELAAKVSAYEPDVKQVLNDFTELTINGMRQKIPVDRITIMEVAPLIE
jgi:alpha-D-ribose 1-methylphosphonate 5-triphosphate diphosphatase PhnM